jgi:5-methylcytosine-specific restriction endonuclease McrA
MRPDLINRRAWEYYGHREDFKRIIERVGSPDNREKLMRRIEDELQRDPQALAIKRQMLIVTRLYMATMCALGVPLLLWWCKVLTGLWTIAIVIGIVVLLFQIGGLNERRGKAYEMRRKAHMDKHAVSLEAAEKRDVELTNRIEEEWDRYCVNFTGYPPDWKYRVLYVLERDDHTCKQCGWPNGFKRKVRQLHVHHVERHSRGGDHAFSNLVTLCGICHSRQAGPGHNRIKPRRRRRRGSVEDI